MANTNYKVGADGDVVLISVPISNQSGVNISNAGVTFNAFNSTLTAGTPSFEKGEYTALSRTWDSVELKDGESTVFYIPFTVADIDLAPITISGTITGGAVDGNDGTGTGVSITITKEEDQATNKQYKAVITQSGTSAPTATVLKNELSAAVVWARSSEGVYTATLASAFVVSKTWFDFSKVGNPTGKVIYLDRTDANVLTLSSFESDGTTPDDLDGSINLVVEVFP